MSPILPILLFITIVAGNHDLREAKDEEFPFQASIQSLDNRHICGGAIIAQKWVLTSLECVRNYGNVLVSMGSANSADGKEKIKSSKIAFQAEANYNKKNTLALIQLEKNIEHFSDTLKQGSLPTHKAKLGKTAKISGWTVPSGFSSPIAIRSPILHVGDKYHVLTENCTTESGVPIKLNIDEFCGMADESSINNNLNTLGTIVSKKNIILGIITENKPLAIGPTIFVKLSEHEQWIKDTLGKDAEYVSWEDEIPKNSAIGKSISSIFFLILVSTCVRHL